MKHLLFFYILFFSLFGGEDVISLLNKVSKECVRYTFKSNDVIQVEKERPYKKKVLKLIARELNKNGFTYNEKKDTVLICLDYADEIVTKAFSFLWFSYYVSCPVWIHAYSSMGEIHLSLVLNEGNYVQKTCDDDLYFGKNDPLPGILKEGDIELFLKLYSRFFIQESITPLVCSSDRIRIIIEDGQIISATNWIYYLGPDYFNTIQEE